MSFLFMLPLLFIPISPTQDPTTVETAPVAVVSFKWFKDRRETEVVDNEVVVTSPDPAMRKRNWERARRAQDPSGAREANSGSIEARSAALDRIARIAYESYSPPVQGFTYRAKIQNNSAKAVTTVFWEFKFTEKANPENVSRRQFVCSAKVKPEKRNDLAIFTATSPSNVISLDTLKKKMTEAFDEAVRINRVEYEDGTFWQRPDWDFEEVKMTVKPDYTRKWERCQGL